MLTYHCDALLPQVERYASLKFRRVAQWFFATKMSFDDAVELMAFVRTVGGPRFAGVMLHWKPTAYRSYARLEAHKPLLDYVQAAHRANLETMTPEDGLAVLRVLQECGWTKGALPPIVKQSIAEVLQYTTYPKLARELGLTVDQIQWAAGRRQNRIRRDRARAAGALAL